MLQSKGGKITPDSLDIKEGESQEFKIQADKGYFIKDDFVDENSAGAVTKYYFKNVSGKHTISAVFEKKSTNQSDPGDTNTGDISNSVKNPAVKTGDLTDILTPTIVLGIAIGLLVVIIYKKKKYSDI